MHPSQRTFRFRANHKLKLELKLNRSRIDSRVSEERHQSSKSDAAPPELALVSLVTINIRLLRSQRHDPLQYVENIMEEGSEGAQCV